MSTETVEAPQTLAEYKAERLNPPDPHKEESKEEPKAEEKAEDVKEDDGEKERKPKNKLTERFSELTTQRNAERAAREAAEARAVELEARLAEAEGKKAAPVDNDVGPKPKKEEYTDPFEYAEDLAKWSADKALKDDRAAQQKAAEEAKKVQVLKAWQSRIAAAKDEIDDFEEVTTSSQAVFSDLVKDTIIESEFGPQLLYYFAADDDEAEKLNKMSAKDALRYIGKLEARFEAKQEAGKSVAKDVKPADEPRKRPPDPVKPIRASSAAGNPVSDPGEFTGTYSEWKALRQKGRV